jgi:LysR family glycine cleavage system transcriptional activator
MKRERPNLPSLGALAVFEAAARHMSFTAAARELNVTQAAVSKRIKALEQDLGLVLFRRSGRALALTAQGQALARRTRSALDFLEEGCAHLQGMASAPIVTIAANTAVSHFWLGPKLRQYALVEPATTVRLLTSDRTIDLVGEDNDIVIHYGQGERPGWNLLPIFPERLVPVASPRYLAAVGIEPETALPIPPNRLASMALLDYEQFEAGWTTLDMWFDWVGATRPKLGSLQLFSSYAITIEAALSGDGIALGSLSLLADILGEGRLIELSDRIFATGQGYYIGMRRDRAIQEPALHLLRWLSGGPA